MQSDYKELDLVLVENASHQDMWIYNYKSKPPMVHEAKILVGEQLW